MAKAGFDALVGTDWLAANLEDPELRIFDCTVTLVPFEGGVRPHSGRADWAAGHIPGSGFADLPGDLCDRTSPLSLMMPPADEFARVMGASGAGPGTRVVLYDSGAHTWATRLWWMLHAMGFDDMAVLDGGLRKWKAEHRPLSTEPCRYPPSTFIARPRPGAFVDKQQVRASLDRADVRLINALSVDEHRGKVTRVARPGHIPGSGNVPAGSLLDPHTGAFRPLADLAGMFEAQQALGDRRVITYCGGGIAATSAAFTLRRLGARDVGVYDGSLVDWSQDPDLPMETG